MPREGEMLESIKLNGGCMRGELVVRQTGKDPTLFCSWDASLK